MQLKNEKTNRQKRGLFRNRGTASQVINRNLPTREKIRRTMQAVKSKGSKIETALTKALSARGHRFRKNDKTVFGKPDISFKKIKVAVFVDSEFWHGKNWTVRKHDHKSNQEYWFKKIERNIKRDRQVNRTLRKEGWKVLRFWGEDIENKLLLCIKKIEKTINERTEI